MPAGDLVRNVPILTTRDLPASVAIWRLLGLEVHADHGDYVILATDPFDHDAVEVHLAHDDDHDPRSTAGMVYLRVRDADAVYARVRAAVDAEGLYMAPASGLTLELTAELQKLEDAGTMRTRIHEIEDKPWGQREFALVGGDGVLIRVGSPLP